MGVAMLRTAPFFLALLAATACGGDSGTNPANAGIGGRYELRTVDGSPVPGTLVLDGVSATVDAGHIQITEPNSFSASLTVTTADAATGLSFTVTVPIAGTWTRDDSDIRLITTDGRTYPGTIGNGQLTLTFDDGVVLVFRR